MSVHDYEKLLVWQKSMDLVECVYILTKRFPKEELTVLPVKYGDVLFQFLQTSQKEATGGPIKIFASFFRFLPGLPLNCKHNSKLPED